MIEQINRNFLTEKVEKLETHKYSPEQNKLHFTGMRFKISTPGCVTLESAIDTVLKNPTSVNLLAYAYFGLEFVKWKVLNGKILTENETQDFIHEDYFPEVDRDEGEDRRWSKFISITKEVDGRYFQIGYDKGLTEYQEDSYTDRPVEVYKKTKIIPAREVIYYDLNP